MADFCYWLNAADVADPTGATDGFGAFTKKKQTKVKFTFQVFFTPLFIDASFYHVNILIV